MTIGLGALALTARRAVVAGAGGAVVGGSAAVVEGGASVVAVEGVVAVCEGDVVSRTAAREDVQPAKPAQARRTSSVCLTADPGHPYPEASAEEPA